MNMKNKTIQQQKKKLPGDRDRWSGYLRRFLALVLAVAIVLPQPYQAAAAESSANIGTSYGGEIMTFTGSVGSFFAYGSIETDLGVYMGFNGADTIIMAYPEEELITVTFPANFSIQRPASADWEADPEDEEGADGPEYTRYYAFHVRREDSPDVLEMDLSEVWELRGDVYSAKEVDDQYPGFFTMMNGAMSDYDLTEDSRIILFDEETVADLFREAGPQYTTLRFEVPLTVEVGGDAIPFNVKQTYSASYAAFSWTDEKGFTHRGAGGGSGQMLVTTPKEAIGVKVEPAEQVVTAGDTVEITITCSNYSDMGLEESVLEIYNGYDDSTNKRLIGEISNLRINGIPIDESSYEFTDDGQIVFDRWFSFLRMLPDNMEAQRETNKNNPPFVVTFDYAVHPDDYGILSDGTVEDRTIPIRGVLTAITPANSFNSYQKENLYKILMAQSGYRWVRGAVWDYEAYGDPDLRTYYDQSAGSNYFYVNEPLTHRVPMEEEHYAVVKVVGDFPEPEPDTYTVTYYANYEDAPAPISQEFGPYTEGETVTVHGSELFVRDGYIFLGWSLADEDDTLAYTAEQLAAGEVTFEMPDHNVDLYAQWEEDEEPVEPPGPEPKIHKLNYHANYDDATDTPITQLHEEGSTVTVSSRLFTRSGYTFLGWSETWDGEVKYTADQVAVGGARPTFKMPAHDVDLYAQWRQNPVVPPDPEPSIHKVNYHANYAGATNTPITQFHEEGTTVVVANNLFGRSGYTFLGWSLEDDDDMLLYTAEQLATGEVIFEMPDHDVDLHAQWKEDEEPVDPPGPEPKDPPALIYKPNGGAREDGSVEPYRDESPVAGEYYTILDNDNENLGYEREGYTFLGWHTDPEPEPNTTEGWYQEGTRITVDWEGDKVVYAIWAARETETPDYIVLYDANCDPFEGSVVDGQNAYFAGMEVMVQDNQYLYPPDYYEFVGWNTARDGSGIWYDPADTFVMPDHDVTLYAQWQLKPHQVHYHANATSYTGNVEDGSSYYPGEEVTVMANGFARSGYTFKGWSESADGSVVYTAAQLNASMRPTFTMPGQDVHLYAQWSKDSTGGGGGGGGSSYKVVYHSEYASSTVNDGSYSSGATVTVKEHSVFPAAIIEIPAGATFLGWSDSLNGTSIIYLPDDTFRMPARDVHLYAVYDLETDMLNRDDHYAYVVGYPDGTVRPNDLITREEVTTIFFRLLTDDTRDRYFRRANGFTDVQVGRWSNNAISTMENAGIVTGYEDGSFRPGGNITRAEVAVIAAQFDSTVYNGASKFGDISSHWATSYINRAAERGWVNGYPDGSFRPDEYITRAEMMTLINNVLDRNPESPADLLDDMIRWPDNANTGSWYYLQVQEATNSHYYERYTGNDGGTAGAEYWIQLRPVRDWAALEQRS